jgi:hypothetical protein
MVESKARGIAAKIYGSVNSALKSADFYGVPVSLNLNGEDTFTTSFGGFMSILVRIVMLWYTITELTLIATRGKTGITTNMISKNLLQDNEKFEIAKDGFRIGLGGRHSRGGANILVDPDYLQSHFTYGNQTRNGAGGTINATSTTNITLGVCGYSFSEYIDNSVADALGISGFNCPSSQDWRLGGSETGESYDFAEFVVIKCQGGGTCKTDAEINTAMAGQRIQMAISNFFFDVLEYDDPINITLDNEFQYPLVPGFLVEKHIRIRANTVIDYTNFWYEFAPKEYTYYSVGSVQDRFQPETNGEVFRVVLKMDYSYTYIERKIYTVYDMLGQVGGFMGLVISVAAVIVGIFSDKIYTMTLLSYFYKAENEPYDDEKTAKNNQVQDYSLHLPRNETIKRIVPEYSKEKDEEQKDANKRTIVRSLDILGPDEDVMAKVKAKLLSRHWYKFEWKNLWYLVFGCPKIRCIKRKTKLNQHFEDYGKGADKIGKELDIISILDSVRKANALSMLLLSKHQRILADHQTINYTNDDNGTNGEYPRTVDKIMTVDQLKSSLDEMERFSSFDPSAEYSRKLIDKILCRNQDDFGPMDQNENMNASRYPALPVNYAFNSREDDPDYIVIK